MSETYADRQAIWEKWTAGERLAYGCGHRDGRASASTSWCETCQHPFHFEFCGAPLISSHPSGLICCCLSADYPEDPA